MGSFDVRKSEAGGYSTACRCEQSPKTMMSLEMWEVTMYKYNASAFNGYHYTPSDYSEVRCKGCKARWRTKAKYVDKLHKAGIA